jgi:hypothetical protein
MFQRVAWWFFVVSDLSVLSVRENGLHGGLMRRFTNRGAPRQSFAMGAIPWFPATVQCATE